MSGRKAGRKIVAKNRMYLRCRVCGARFFLGKTFGVGYYMGDYKSTENIKKRLNDFFETHHDCGLLMSDSDDFEDHFDICYEDPPAWARDGYDREVSEFEDRGV